MPSRFQNFLRALKHRNYALFFGGQGLSLIGTWIQQTGEVWLAYRLTHSALYLGVVGFCSQIPTLLLSPIAGAIVDRTNRVRLLIWAQALSMLQAFVLAALVITHRITFPQLVILSLFSGAIDAVEIPVRQSSIVLMVEERADLANAIALNSSLVNIARLIGPSIAGILIGLIGEGWCFFINGVSYLAVIVALFMMRLKSVPVSNKAPTPLKDALLEGARYAIHSVPIVTLLSILAIMSFSAASIAVLWPIFAATILGGGPHTLGFLMGASGFGALVAAIFLAQRPNIIGLTRVIMRGVALFGLCIFLFSFSRSVPLSCLLLTVTGFGMMSSTASINTMIQTIVDEDKRGRVMSFFTTAFMGMAPLGQLFGGALAHHIGAPGSVRVSGVLLMSAAAIFAWRRPHLGKHIRLIYQRLGILPEVAAGLESTTINPRQPS